MKCGVVQIPGSIFYFLIRHFLVGRVREFCKFTIRNLAMNSALASIGKSLILIAILGISAYTYIFGGLSWKDLLAIQSIAGLFYICLSCYEFLNASFKASLPVQRYPYFTNSYFMWRALKVIFFLSFATMLFMSGSRIKYIYPVCLIIAATEAIITILKYKKSLCFVNIYANYLLLVQSKFSKVFASEISLVEFRHDNFYFVKKNKKTVFIKLEHIENKEKFLLAINEWMLRNNVNVSAESKVKIKELIEN